MQTSDQRGVIHLVPVGRSTALCGQRIESSELRWSPYITCVECHKRNVYPVSLTEAILRILVGALAGAVTYLWSCP